MKHVSLFKLLINNKMSNILVNYQTWIKKSIIYIKILKIITIFKQVYWLVKIAIQKSIICLYRTWKKNLIRFTLGNRLHSN